VKGFPALFLLFFAGFLIQIVVAALTAIPYFCPHFVLLLTLACGSFRGTLAAESLGFGWGLALDAMGMTTFGIQGLVLSFTGYFSGILSRWVNAEEPLSQMAFALLGSVFYFLSLLLLEKILGGIGRPLTIGAILSTSLVNTLVSPVVFSVTRRCAGTLHVRTEDLS
jgi:rod shape-determining protein MreD